MKAKTSIQTIAEHAHWRLNFDRDHGDVIIAQDDAPDIVARATIMIPLDQALSLARTILTLGGKGSEEPVAEVTDSERRACALKVSALGRDVCIEQPDLGETYTVLIPPSQVEWLVSHLRAEAGELVRRGEPVDDVRGGKNSETDEPKYAGEAVRRE